MSENKTSEANAPKREKRKIIDRTKVITGLTLNASIVPVFQNILMTLIAQMKNPEDISGVYKKINEIEKHIQEEKEIPMELVLNQFEQMIYTCTYLVQYCQAEAEKQGCMVEVESNPLDPEQTKKMFDLILNEKDKTDNEQSEVMKNLIKSLDVKKV